MKLKKINQGIVLDVYVKPNSKARARAKVLIKDIKANEVRQVSAAITV